MTAQRYQLLWVVEILLSGRWQPTVGVALNRADGRDTLAGWKSLRDDKKYKLRLTPYRRQR